MVALSPRAQALSSIDIRALKDDTFTLSRNVWRQSPRDVTPHHITMEIWFVITFKVAFIYLFIHSFIHSVVCVRQVHSLFQNEFPTQCDLVLPLFPLTSSSKLLTSSSSSFRHILPYGIHKILIMITSVLEYEVLVNKVSCLSVDVYVNT